MNGSLTLGENIADNGGVHTAFQAYKTHANDASTLPGTNLTNDQLFFVAFGQVNIQELYCELIIDNVTGMVYIIYTRVSSASSYNWSS